jgi:stage II sporulation protein AA (anti-sigma F factor antagonist)
MSAPLLTQRLERLPEGAAGVLTLAGDLTVERVGELEAAVDSLLAQGARHLVIDLAALDFIDSASVGHLVLLRRRLEDQGGLALLCSLRPSFRRLLDVSGLSGALPVAPDLVAAFATLRKGPPLAP